MSENLQDNTKSAVNLDQLEMLRLQEYCQSLKQQLDEANNRIRTYEQKQQLQQQQGVIACSDDFSSPIQKVGEIMNLMYSNDSQRSNEPTQAKTISNGAVGQSQDGEQFTFSNDQLGQQWQQVSGPPQQPLNHFQPYVAMFHSQPLTTSQQIADEQRLSDPTYPGIVALQEPASSRESKESETNSQSTDQPKKQFLSGPLANQIVALGYEFKEEKKGQQEGSFMTQQKRFFTRNQGEDANIYQTRRQLEATKSIIKNVIQHEQAYIPDGQLKQLTQEGEFSFLNQQSYSRTQQTQFKSYPNNIQNYYNQLPQQPIQSNSRPNNFLTQQYQFRSQPIQFNQDGMMNQQLMPVAQLSLSSTRNMNSHTSDEQIYQQRSQQQYQLQQQQLEFLESSLLPLVTNQQTISLQRHSQDNGSNSQTNPRLSASAEEVASVQPSSPSFSPAEVAAVEPLSQNQPNLQNQPIIDEDVPIPPNPNDINRQLQDLQNLYLEMERFGRIGDLLFEDIMIIGPSKQDLADQAIAAIQQQNAKQPAQQQQQRSQKPKEYVKRNSNASILLSMPGYKDASTCNQRQSVASLAFPRGVQYYQYRPTQNLNNMDNRFRDIILLDWMSFKSENLSKKSFVINLSGNSTERSNLSQQANPMQNTYAICLKENEAMVYYSEETQQYVLFRFEVVYCVMTQYPFVDFFMQVLHQLFNRVKSTRLSQCNFSGNIDNGLINSDLSSIIEYLREDKKLILSIRKLQLQSLNHGRRITYHIEGSNLESIANGHTQTFESRRITYLIPQPDNLWCTEQRAFGCLCISNLAFKDFMFILSLVMLEKKIVFLSQNMALLTYTVLTFSSLVKPFIYPHPLVSSLSQEVLFFIEGIVPFICGLNSSFESYKRNNQVINELFYIDLDNSAIIAPEANIAEVATHVFRFGSHRNAIRQLYENLNGGLTSRRFSSAFKKVFTLNNRKDLIYQPTRYQYIILDQLLGLIKQSIVQNITANLPDFIPMQSEQDNLIDMRELSRLVLSECNPNSPDSEYRFVELFLQTQIFQYYLDKMYF